MTCPTPARVPRRNSLPVNEAGRYVFYWMTASRRTRYNAALDRAVEWARRLDQPLLVLEALSVDYPWASDRLHRFVLEGMEDNRRAFERAGVTYLPFVEQDPGAGGGLVSALARDSCVMVVDDHPGFIYPDLLAAAARLAPVALESIDSCGLFPLALVPREYHRAHGIRRFFHRTVLDGLPPLPRREPLDGLQPEAAHVPAEVLTRWPMSAAPLETDLSRLPIDHGVPVAPIRGGPRAASTCMATFFENGLDRYASDRSHPDRSAESGLSPYLHFGHLSSAEVVDWLLRRESWAPDRLDPDSVGRRSGFWGMSEGAEAFIDQIVTWRELCFNTAFHNPNFWRFESLPNWARLTLGQRESDSRDAQYSMARLEEARTHDEVWNAAQRELRDQGQLHGYMRMLWGKRILEWSDTPLVAFSRMVTLNNRYALDGRDPNSYGGIGWVFGRYDRPWGPKRPIFGSVRYMSSLRARQKLDMEHYLRRPGAPQ